MRIVVVVAILAMALSGCSQPGPGGVEAGLITPGSWHVSGETEYMMAWVHNDGDEEVRVTWSLTLADGAPLPAGWSATFAPASATLDADGSKRPGPRASVYTAWSYTRITLTVPAGASGTLEAELHAGEAVEPFTFAIDEARTRVSAPGDQVTAEYDGRFEDNQERFDAGEFPTTLGSGDTVAGFDNGLMGLALGEKARLIIPPAFAYGYDNPAGSGKEQFNGETLQFDVTLAAFG